ncbi:MAG TPA: DUF6448 family protein [Hyphomicrobiaceae bacterium]
MATVIAGFLASPAFAHCDSVDGPVAGAAIEALETGNVNLALPYAPASAEDEIKAAHQMAWKARVDGKAAAEVADRWFMETVVRLHREGEGATFTGLKPAGINYGPVIPAAEKALETGDPTQVKTLLSGAVERLLEERFKDAQKVLESTRKTPPQTAVEVAEARERVNAEFAFIEYAEGIHAALKAEGHAH